MLNFLDTHKVISNNQGGFRKSFSTAATIASLTDKLLCNINNGQTSLAAFIDLRKAFDTVKHKILLKKLFNYGVRNFNLEWCTNYLTNCTQQTLAYGILSKELTVSCGVPQGLVLGPLFFILYINDVQMALRGSNLQLYADDTVFSKLVKITMRLLARSNQCWISSMYGVMQTYCLSTLPKQTNGIRYQAQG